MQLHNLKHIVIRPITRLVLALVVVLSIAGCKGTKDSASKTNANDQPAPEWVTSRPRSGAYYIGLGNANKTTQPLDYQNIAKKNALNDLASEISVRVQGSTFLNSLEVNKNFSEEFISTISTTTDEKIENFEIAGIWENQKEYWVYYRLNKAEYQRQKAEKKNQALNAAYDLYSKGLAAENTANITMAMDQYMRGLFAMRDYWNDINEYQKGDEKIYLDREIYARMQQAIANLTLRPTTTRVVLSSENNYRSDVTAILEYKGIPVRGVEVTHSYQKTRFMKPRVGTTDEKGMIYAVVDDVNGSDKNNKIEFSIDAQQFIAKDLDLRIQQGLIKGLRPESRSIPIELVTPTFFITSDEKSYGQPTTGKVLSAAFGSELVKQGMKISSQSGETNYVVNISSNTTSGGTSQGFTVAYMELTVVVTNTTTGDIVYKEALTNIKGLQLNEDAASQDAYKKGKDRIEKEIVKALIDVLM